MRVLVVYGTRPEVIKLAEVIRLLKSRDGVQTVVCATGQHREMLEQAERVFGLVPDIDLDVMVEDQPLNLLASKLFGALDGVLTEVAPDWLIVQGDTTTAACAALAAFHRRVRVAHVEAGLRTGDLERPFPEEANRRVVDLVSTLLFAPTPRARENLLSEGVSEERILLTGNTVVDALRRVADEAERTPRRDEVLVTVHRRESFGEPLERVVAALARLAGRNPSVTWTLPVHPNPNVKKTVAVGLSGLENVRLTEPMDYPTLVRALRRVRLVLTDSGGIQEEAPAFGTPVLVLREATERPEALEVGAAELVGFDPESIVTRTEKLLSDEDLRIAMASAPNPFGDGLAAERIVAAIVDGVRREWDGRGWKDLSLSDPLLQ
ncbi:MAG: UDP-N-acetyl glucosamine 2-epimerase [Acidimicrobiales bacterium]|nr:MAG: UDP-N-acetyl glucosamine 2-epimerase [Acidimicrobiales bacterium]